MKFSSRVYAPGADIPMQRPHWEDVLVPPAPAPLSEPQPAPPPHLFSAPHPPPHPHPQPQPLRALPDDREVLTTARLRAAEILEEAEAAAQELLSEARARGYEEGQAKARSEAAADLEAAQASARAEAEALRSEAEAALEAARRQADDVREAATREATTLREQAANEARGVRAAAQTEADQLKQQAWDEVHRYLDSTRQAVVELALAVAGRILQYELAVRPEAVAGLVAAGLERLRSEDATVALSPHDLPLLEARRDDLRRAAGLSHLELAEDRALAAGDFIIRSRHGEIDGRQERQLDSIRQPLLQTVREAVQP